jgi:hypothetical protein
MSRLRIVNEETDSATRFFHMTFDSSILDENQKIIRKDLVAKYINLQTQYIVLIKKMDNLINFKNKI